MHYIIVLYVIFLITSLLIPLAIKSADKIGILDCPNARKIHTKPIPRTGGIVISFSVLLLYFLMIPTSTFSIGYLAGGIILFIFGIIDDCISLNYKLKLASQIVASLLFVTISGISIDYIGEIFPDIIVRAHYLRIPLTVFFIVAAINIINLSDGLDALAAGLAIIIFICLSFLAYTSGNTQVLYLVLLMIGSILGFLRFNVFPASIFMGDTGSQFIGYTLGISLLAITQEGSIYSPVIYLFILGMPVIDTCYVICFRLSNGRNPFLPDKNHIHHKLIELGLSQDKSVAIIYIMHFVLIICGWCMRSYPDYYMFAAYLILFLMVCYIRKCWLVDDTAKIIFFAWINRRLRPFSVYKHLFSRFFFSKIVWKLFFISLGSYYFFAPVLFEKINYTILLLFFSLFVLFFIFYMSKIFITPRRMKFFFYLLSLFVVIYFKNTIYVTFADRTYFLHIHDIFFILLSILYFLCVVFSPEKAPINSIDYLFIVFIVFVFFIPDSIDFIKNSRSIIIKTTLLGFFINLVFSRIERNRKFVFCIFLYFFVFLSIQFALNTMRIY